MYQVGQYIVYGSHGVCQIMDLEEKSIDHKLVQYYALEPLSRPGTRYYIPVHNAIAVGKLRLPLSRGEISAMVDIPVDDACWIADENRRKIYYRELIGNLEPQTLFAMVRLLRLHRQEQLKNGRKFHVNDANFLKDAENLLASEIAFVLGVDKEKAYDLF